MLKICHVPDTDMLLKQQFPLNLDVIKAELIKLITLSCMTQEMPLFVIIFKAEYCHTRVFLSVRRSSS